MSVYLMAALALLLSMGSAAPSDSPLLHALSALGRTQSVQCNNLTFDSGGSFRNAASSSLVRAYECGVEKNRALEKKP